MLRSSRLSATGRSATSCERAIRYQRFGSPASSRSSGLRGSGAKGSVFALSIAVSRPASIGLLMRRVARARARAARPSISHPSGRERSPRSVPRRTPLACRRPPVAAPPGGHRAGLRSFASAPVPCRRLLVRRLADSPPGISKSQAKPRLLLLRNMRVLHDPDELRDFGLEKNLELLRPAADRLVGPSAQPLQHIRRVQRLCGLALNELEDVARGLRRRKPGLPARGRFEARHRLRDGGN